MVSADANMPFSQSTCISCGNCLQFCPTGTLTDRRSSFMGRSNQAERVKSICNRCSIGCGTSIITRGGNGLRIEGDWGSPVNGGLLCKSGRFEPLYDERKRLLQPMIRRGKKLETASWEEAIAGIADKMENAKATEIGLLISGDATNEALYLANRLFKEGLNAQNVGLLSGASPDLMAQKTGNLSDLSGSDLILVVGANPVSDQPVASFLVKRLVDKGTRLIVVDDGENGLSPVAETTLNIEDIGKAIEIADTVKKVAVLYGKDVTEQAAQALTRLAAKAVFVSLEPGVNTRAAVAFGMNNGFQPASAKILYTMLGEADWNGGDILNTLDPDAFVILQAGYASLLTDRADVVLPSAIWSERSGSLTNTEGIVQMANQAVEPEGEAKPDWEILAMLGDRLGKNIGASFADISARAAQELK
jgi:formate dehydrogenase major subunit